MILCEDVIMAKRYRPVLRDQPFLLPPDMREWLPADHPVHLVIEVVDHHLDTSVVHATRRAGRAGAAGYDPDMLTALVVWAYANRVTSSRRIEQLCRTDVAFKLICAGQVPDHVTIARFRAALGPAAAGLFDQVLILCARLGMGRLGVIALDGTKVKASASLAANKNAEALRQLAAQIAAEHAATDTAEDALFGPGVRGDELPAELADPRGRAERIAAALAELDAEEDAARRRGEQEQERAAGYLSAPSRSGRPPGPVQVEAARRRLASTIAEQEARIAGWDARNADRAASGRPLLTGRRPLPPGQCRAVARAAAALQAAAGRAASKQATTGKDTATTPSQNKLRNVTDPHSRLMPVRGGGFIQGYNAQLVTSSDGLILATKLTSEPIDTPWFEPMLRAAERAAALITASQPAASNHNDSPPIGLILADAGYLSGRNLTIDGPDRLIATGKNRHLRTQATGKHRPGDWADPAIAAMAARLATDDGITAYRHRCHIAETPNGNIKHNLAFRQFSLRGMPRVTAEWNLVAAVTNLLKAISTGYLTIPALTALAR
jgi:transposase